MLAVRIVRKLRPSIAAILFLLAGGAAVSAQQPDYDSAPEPSHKSLMRLFMAANSDLVHGEYFALENYLTSHVQPASDTRSQTAECRRLNSLARNNEVEFRRFVGATVEILDHDLADASRWPKTAVFKLRERHRLNAYDEDRQAFPVSTIGGGAVFGGKVVIGRDGHYGNEYRGPVEKLCSVHFPDPQRMVRGWSGAEVFPGTASSRRASFSLSLESHEIVTTLPMSPGDANSLLSAGSRHVDIEVLLEAGPAEFNARAPGSIPGRIIAARALAPETGRVLHEFVVPDPETKTVADAPSPVGRGSTAIPIRPHHLDLLAVRHAPELLTDTLLTRFASQQVRAEQASLKAIEKQLIRQERMRQSGNPGDGLHPDNPVLSYSYQNGDLDREILARLFVDHDADWDFVTADDRYDRRFVHLVDAFIFDPARIQGRDPGFVGREFASVFGDHLIAAAAQAPDRLEIEVKLPAVAYDFESRAIRFQSGGSDEFAEGAPLFRSLNYDVDPEAAGDLFLYSGEVSPVPITHEQASNPGNPGMKYGGTAPSEAWRRVIGDLIGHSGRASALAMDREMVLRSIPMDSSRAERLTRELGSIGRGLRARLMISIKSADVAPVLNNRTKHTVLFRTSVDAISIVSPSGEAVANVDPASLRDRGLLRRQEAERNRLVFPDVQPRGDEPILLTAQSRELLVAKHHPEVLDDAMVSRMIETRWGYESSLLRSDTVLPEGEIFIRRDRREPEMIPLPREAALGAAVPPFRNWILERARAVPDRIALEFPVGQVKPGKYPGTAGLPASFGGGASSCARQLRMLKLNSGPREVEAYTTACDFMRVVERLPGSHFTCTASGGFGGLHWNCSRFGNYFNALVKAADRFPEARFRDDRLNVDRVVAISDTVAEQAKGRSATLRIIADLERIELSTGLSPTLATEAIEAAGEFLTRNGLRPFSYKPPSTTTDGHWALDLAVQEAELVDSRSGETIASLDLESLPEIPLDLLVDPEGGGAREPGSGPYGPEVLGLQLGMSFDAADAAIRGFMEVDEVLVADRSWSTDAILDKDDWYTSGRFYISRDRRQIVTIYDEPPAAEGIVAGAVFQLLVPKAPGIDKSIFAQLIRKYGEPDVWMTDAVRPGQNPYWIEDYVHPAGRNKPWGDSYYTCTSASYWNFNLRKIWRSRAGEDTGVLDDPRFARVPELARGHDNPNSACTAAVTATVDPDSFDGFVGLNLWLSDKMSYHRLFEESLKAPGMIASADAAATDDASGADPLAGFLSAPAPETPSSQDRTDPGQAAGSGSGVAVFEARIASGRDDVEQATSGKMYFDSSDLELVDDPGNNGTGQIVGLRFTGIEVPQGATIAKASVRFTSEGGPKTDPTFLQIFAIDTDNVAEFTPTANDLVLRPMTGSFVDWSPEPWTRQGVKHETPDLTRLVQSVISRPGWRSGNAIGFMILGAGERSAHSFDGNQASAPVLRVEYGSTDGASATVSAQTDSRSAEAASSGSGYDVIGLRLGMSFDEADALIRKEMEVGKVYRADRSWSPSAATGQIEPYTSGRLYLSADENELIVLYDEPPAAEGTITALVRQLRLPKGQVPAEAIYNQLREKYGREVLISKDMAPSPVLTWFTFPGGAMPSAYTFNAYCHPVKMTMFSLGRWRNEDGSDIWDSMRFVTAPMPDTHVIAPMSNEAAKDCGNGVAAAVDSIFDPEWDSLNIWLYDTGAYAKHFERSKEAIAGGGAGASAGSAPKLKL